MTTKIKLYDVAISTTTAGPTRLFPLESPTYTTEADGASSNSQAEKKP